MTRFADVVTLCTARTADPLAAGIERFVGLEHIEPENLHIHSWGNVADGTTFTSTFKRGQVLFGKRRAYQRKVAVAGFDGVCSGDIYIFESKDPNKLLPELLPFICQSEGFYQYALKTSAGSLSPRTNWSHLANYEFPLPPLDEQRRIADLLWAADSAILEYENLFLSSGKMLTSILVDIFSESKWKQEKLEKHVVESLYGPRFSNTLYSDKGLVACLRTTDMLADGTIIYSTVPSVDLNPEDFKEHILQLGDFMISRSGTCGIATVFEGNSKITIPGAFLIRLRLKKSLNPMFLREYINSPIGQIRMGSLASGGVQKNIRGSLFLQENIPLPDLDIQAKTVEEIKTFRSSHKQIAEHIEKLKKVKSQLIQSQLG